MSWKQDIYHSTCLKILSATRKILECKYSQWYNIIREPLYHFLNLAVHQLRPIIVLPQLTSVILNWGGAAATTAASTRCNCLVCLNQTQKGHNMGKSSCLHWSYLISPKPTGAPTPIAALLSLPCILLPEAEACRAALPTLCTSCFWKKHAEPDQEELLQEWVLPPQTFLIWLHTRQFHLVAAAGPTPWHPSETFKAHQLRTTGLFKPLKSFAVKSLLLIFNHKLKFF